MLCQKQLSRAGISNYIPQYQWDVITYPCPWYLLLAQHSSYHVQYILRNMNTICALLCFVVVCNGKFYSNSLGWFQWPQGNYCEVRDKITFINFNTAVPLKFGFRNGYVIAHTLYNGCNYLSMQVSRGLWCWGWNIPGEQTERSSGWLPLSRLGTLKLVFNVSSDDQGSHPDDLYISVI